MSYIFIPIPARISYEFIVVTSLNKVMIQSLSSLYISPFLLTARQTESMSKQTRSFLSDNRVCLLA